MPTPEYLIRCFRENDSPRIIEIYNYYVRNTFAAYPKEPVPLSFIDYLRKDALSFYVAEKDNEVVGFSFIRPFLPFSTFKSTATVTYFLDPEHTRFGIGNRFLEVLESDAKQMGICTILAHIASCNRESINFHRKHGFFECGRLPGVGVKFDEHFDVIWMAKTLGQ